MPRDVTPGRGSRHHRHDNRWNQLGDPVTVAEAQALETLRDLLPDSPLTHAWTNVTFRDRDGRAS